VLTHPAIMESVQLRHADIEEGRAPSLPIKLESKQAK
jgi:hypothetical protein